MHAYLQYMLNTEDAVREKFSEHGGLVMTMHAIDHTRTIHVHTAG